MPQNNHNPEITATRSVNINFVKPNGISSFLSWFGKKNKNVNFQNVMLDKNFKLKLNIEEFNTLKQNGIDIQKLKNLANNDKKVSMGENIFIVPKDHIELDKNDLLDNSVLTNLLKNKDRLNNNRKYEKSIVSSSTVSIKSKKKDIFNSDFTYIHRIKSKKSVVKSISSRASLKVGLKNRPNSLNNGFPMNSINKSVVMKNFTAKLLKEDKQKRVFVPVYLGRKRSGNIIKIEKNKINENTNKFRPEDQSNVIPLLLTKIRNLEGQLINIDNTTKQINEVVSNKTLLKPGFPSLSINNEAKTLGPEQSVKNFTGHKIHPKKSSKKLKQIQPSKTENKSKNTSPINSKYSLKNLIDSHHLITKSNRNKNSKSIKDILKNPEILLKTDNFVIPNNISKKKLFQANPDAGCDIILKLYEILSETNDSSNSNDSNEENSSKKSKMEMGLKSKEINRCNNSKHLCSAKPHSHPFRKYKSLSSISESQMVKINQRHSNFGKTKHTGSSCPSSSRGNTVGDDNENLVLKENLIHKVEQNNNHNNETSDEKLKSVLQKIEVKDLEANNIGVYVFNKKLKSTNKDIRTDEEKSAPEINIETKKITDFKTFSDKVSEADEDSDVMVKAEVPKNVFNDNSSEIKSCKGVDHIFNEKEDNGPIPGTKSNTPDEDDKITGREICSLPITVDSRNICSISIKQEESRDDETQPGKLTRGTTQSCSNSKKEPKFSITILVEKNSNDDINPKINQEKNIKNDCTKITFKEFNKDRTCIAYNNHPHFEVKENINNSKILNNDIDGKLQLTIDSNCTKDKSTTRREVPKISVVPELRANSGVTNIHNLEGEKEIIPKTNEEDENNFGLSDATYLNREQRKLFDLQLLNAKYDKNSIESTKPKLKQLAKSTINLNSTTKPFRHLSEYSLDSQKIVGNGFFKTNNQQYSKIEVKSAHNQRKTPFYLDNIKFRKATDFINKPEAFCGSKNQTQLQDFSTMNGDCLGKKEEFCINTSSLDCFALTEDYFETIKSSLRNVMNENELGNKQNFLLIKGSETQNNPNHIQVNSGGFNSIDTRKRSCRFSLTLNQNPVIEEREDDLFCDELSVGDHQTKTCGNNVKKKNNMFNGTFFQNCIHFPEEKKLQAVTGPNECTIDKNTAAHMTSFVRIQNENTVKDIQNDLLITDDKQIFNEYVFKSQTKVYKQEGFSNSFTNKVDMTEKKVYNKEIDINNETFCYGSCFNPSENIWNDIPEAEDQHLLFSNASTVSAPSHLLELNSKLINYYNRDSGTFSLDKLFKAKIILDYEDYGTDDNADFCGLNEDFRVKMEENNLTSESQTSQSRKLRVGNTHVKRSLSFIDEISKEGSENHDNIQSSEGNNQCKECRAKVSMETVKNKHNKEMPVVASEIMFKSNDFTKKNHSISQQKSQMKTASVSKISDINSSQERNFKKQSIYSHSHKTNLLPASQSKQIKFSRNFLVNCVYRVEYDILRKNDSFITCSLDTCSSTK